MKKNKQQFWKEGLDGSRYFDFESLYESLSDGPETDAEKEMINELWYEDSDVIIDYFEDERLTTKEAYTKIHDRLSFVYHKEEYSSGLG